MKKQWWWSCFLLSLLLIVSGCAPPQAPGAAAEGGAAAPAEQASEREEIPQFDWPPPRASATANVPFRSLSSIRETIYLSEIDQIISSALEEGGYVEKSYYAVPDGFAMVTRLERINEDGTPLDGPTRWSTEVGPLREFSLREYFRALFRATPGYYRIIVFIVTPHPFSQTTARVERDEAMEWLHEGTNKLPRSIGERLYASEYTCTALIYQFEQPGRGEDVVLKIDSVPTGRQHLERANLWKALLVH